MPRRSCVFSRKPKLQPPHARPSATVAAATAVVARDEELLPDFMEVFALVAHWMDSL